MYLSKCMFKCRLNLLVLLLLEYWMEKIIEMFAVGDDTLENTLNRARQWSHHG